MRKQVRLGTIRCYQGCGPAKEVLKPPAASSPLATHRAARARPFGVSATTVSGELSPLGSPGADRSGHGPRVGHLELGRQQASRSSRQTGATAWDSFAGNSVSGLRCLLANEVLSVLLKPERVRDENGAVELARPFVVPQSASERVLTPPSGLLTGRQRGPLCNCLKRLLEPGLVLCANRSAPSE